MLSNASNNTSFHSSFKTHPNSATSSHSFLDEGPFKSFLSISLSLSDFAYHIIHESVTGVESLKTYSIPIYYCNECRYRTSNKSHLNRHHMRHTGERPFRCVVCDKGFITGHHLRYHVPIHVRLATSGFHLGFLG